MVLLGMCQRIQQSATLLCLPRNGLDLRLQSLHDQLVQEFPSGMFVRRFDENGRVIILFFLTDNQDAVGTFTPLNAKDIVRPEGVHGGSPEVWFVAVEFELLRATEAKAERQVYIRRVLSPTSILRLEHGHWH